MLSGSSMIHSRVIWNEFQLTGIENIFQGVVGLVLFTRLRGETYCQRCSLEEFVAGSDSLGLLKGFSSVGKEGRGYCFPFNHALRIIYMCVGFFFLKKYLGRKSLTSPVTSVAPVLFKVKRKQFMYNSGRNFWLCSCGVKNNREDVLWNICYMEMLYCGQLNWMTWSSVSVFSFIVFKCSQ